MTEAIIRLQALDGTWETCGVDRLRGIVPQDLQASSNAWGSDTCSFTLRRDPGATYPDLSAFTPIEVEIASELVWSGRVKETPIKDGPDGQISVQAQGWQYHLDDDPFERVWVHTRLSDWKDCRSFAAEDLTQFVAQGQVSNDSGSVSLGWPQNVATPTTGAFVGVTLDLGPDSTGKRLVFTYESSNPGANWYLEYRGHDTPAARSTGEGPAAGGVGASGTGAHTFTTARRYLSIFIISDASITKTADVWLKITAARVFRDTAYESGNVSVLKASDVIKDARDTAAPLLSTSNAAVSASSFSLPELAPGAPRTAREVMSAVNALHDWDLKVDVNKRVVFRAKPSAPLFEVGEWSGAEFEDASANSGEEVYNRVVVEATGPDGAPLRVERTQAELDDTLWRASTVQPPNPSFTVDASSWSGGMGRSTAVYNSSPASGQFAVGSLVYTTITGLQAGLRYRISFYGRLAAGASGTRIWRVWRDAGPTSGGVEIGDVGVTVSSTTWTVGQIAFMAPASETVVLGVSDAAGSGDSHVDDLWLESSAATLVDRRVFRRTKILPVQAALTEATGEQMADTYLLNHKTVPFKGSLSVAFGGVRRVLGGQPVHPAHLLTQTIELIRFAHRIDPDTGGHGRDGRAATVSYMHNTEHASVAIDNDRQSFEALLERYGALVG